MKRHDQTCNHTLFTSLLHTIGERSKIETKKLLGENLNNGCRFNFPGNSDFPLSDRDKEILEFERQWWKYSGAKEQAIRELFGMSATRYYQVLNALVDHPSALSFDPMLIKRLQRIRSARARNRSARKLGIQL